MGTNGGKMQLVTQWPESCGSLPFTNLLLQVVNSPGTKKYREKGCYGGKKREKEKKPGFTYRVPLVFQSVHVFLEALQKHRRENKSQRSRKQLSITCGFIAGGRTSLALALCRAGIALYTRSDAKNTKRQIKITENIEILGNQPLSSHPAPDASERPTFPVKTCLMLLKQ